jgi:hypothetical protein
MTAHYEGRRYQYKVRFKWLPEEVLWEKLKCIKVYEIKYSWTTIESNIQGELKYYKTH